MKWIFAIVLGVAFIAIQSKAAPAANVDEQPGAQPLQLSDLISQAQNHINTLSTQIQQQLNLPNQEEFTNTLKEQSTNLANNVQEYIKNITEEVRKYIF